MALKGPSMRAWGMHCHAREMNGHNVEPQEDLLQTACMPASLRLAAISQELAHGGCCCSETMPT